MNKGNKSYSPFKLDAANEPNGLNDLNALEKVTKGTNVPYNTKERNMAAKPLFIRAEWDEEASVWVATSDDVPGLATEEATMEGLIDKLKIIIPELLEANGVRIDQAVPFEVLTRRFETTQTTDL